MDKATVDTSSPEYRAGMMRAAEIAQLYDLGTPEGYEIARMIRVEISGGIHWSKNPEVIEAVKKWLGAKGLHFFRTLYKLKKTVNPVLRLKGPVPIHPVHFREGMTVRNFLRTLPQCDPYDPHDLDDNWAIVVTKAIGR